MMSEKAISAVFAAVYVLLAVTRRLPSLGLLRVLTRSLWWLVVCLTNGLFCWAVKRALGRRFIEAESGAQTCPD